MRRDEISRLRPATERERQLLALAKAPTKVRLQEVPGGLAFFTPLGQLPGLFSDREQALEWLQGSRYVLDETESGE